MMAVGRVIAVGLFALLSACAAQRPVPPVTAPPPQPTPSTPTDVPRAADEVVPKHEPRSKQGNPRFYEVAGQRYFVLPSAEGYNERGVASWYGPGFHKGTTSNGERYDMYAMTAAHKTLPLPSYVRVTNLKNGRSVVLRVNDRGPFKDTRIIDVSYTAAAKLDMLKAGTAFVEVQALIPDGPAPAQPQTGPDVMFVQAGSFGDRANADRLVTKLAAEGIRNATVREDVVNGRAMFRVRVGPVPTVNDYDRVVVRLRRLGVNDARLAWD